MPFLPWSDRFRIGVSIFDAEHMRLIAMTNEAYDAIFSDLVAQKLEQIFLGLIDYTYSHFEHEESYFATADYPFAAEHKAQHDRFRSDVQDFQRRMASAPKQLLALELSKFLKIWIECHILEEDKKYAQFLNDKGIG